MSHALALGSAPETRWTILSGPLKGSMRVMNQAQFYIGRSQDCEMVIPHDPKCSRRHAQVRWNGSNWEIASLVENNPVMVNGNEQTQGLLKNGDQVTVGETTLLVNFNQLQTGAGHLEIVTDSPVAPPVLDTRPRSRRRTTKVSSQNKNRIIIYGIIGAIVVWLFIPSGKKKEALKLRSEQDIQADIETVQKLKEAAETLNLSRVDNNLIARQAQENYVRGFRDYREGQFERSLVSFQACLALNPQHALCTRYLRLAQRKFNELVQYHMVLGRKYRDQNQFRACRSAFRNVMVMVKDSNSAIYKEAKVNYEACNASLEGRY